MHSLRDPPFFWTQTTREEYGDLDLVIKFWFRSSSMYCFTSGYSGLGVHFFCTGWLSFRLISISRSGMQPMSSLLDENDSYSFLSIVSAIIRWSRAKLLRSTPGRGFCLLCLAAQEELTWLISEVHAV